MTESKPDDPVRVMLVDDNEQRATWLKDCLKDSGFELCSVVTDSLSLLREISEAMPDVVIIDVASPGRDILESLSILSEQRPTPVVMFSEEDDPAYIAKAVDAGVSTYLFGGVDSDRVRPIIEVALAQFRSFQQLRSALADTRAELNEQRTVDRAKRLLMQRLGLSEEETYKRLRSEAMNANIRIAEAADKILKRLA